MENFTAYNPVRLIFGKGVINQLHQIAPQYGKKALVVYGQGSVKKYQILPQVTNQLSLAGIKFIEFSGIKPNPRIDEVRQAADLAKKENIDFIVAVGGGSVIDSAKVIALAAKHDFDPWQFVIGQVQPTQALPLLTVLTVAGTGSEMNNVAVLQNLKTQQKLGFRHELMFPKASFLDPSYTISVPRFQTACGIADIIAHALEAYFGDGNSPLADKFATQIIREVMGTGLKLVNDLYNYDLRARIMLASTYALNGTTAIGRGNTGDWGTHAIGHVLSLLYDIPHGATLSIAFPAWMKLMLNQIPERIRKLGRLVFNDGCLTAQEVIVKFEEFFQLIDLPIRLSEVNLTKEDAQIIEQLLNKLKATGRVFELDDSMRSAIVDYMAHG